MIASSGCRVDSERGWLWFSENGGEIRHWDLPNGGNPVFDVVSFSAGHAAWTDFEEDSLHGRVYWLDYDDSENIWSWAQDGGNPVRLVDWNDTQFIEDMGLDAERSHLYFSGLDCAAAI